MDPGYFEKVKKIFDFGAVQKELVDPYCTVLFAGKNGETPVIWNEQDPVWNYQINLGIRVSSTDTALFSSYPSSPHSSFFPSTNHAKWPILVCS